MMTMDMIMSIVFVGVVLAIGAAFMYILKVIIDGIIAINQAKNHDKAMLEYWSKNCY